MLTLTTFCEHCSSLKNEKLRDQWQGVIKTILLVWTIFTKGGDVICSYNDLTMTSNDFSWLIMTEIVNLDVSAQFETNNDS